MERHYYGIARIQSQDGVTWGAGLVVGSNKVITCAHVVRDAQQNSRVLNNAEDGLGFVHLQRPWVRENDQQPFLARVVKLVPANSSAEIRDLAELELVEGHFDTDQNLPDLVLSQNYRNHKVRVRGFPNGAESAEAYAVLQGQQPNGWTDLTSVRGHGEEIRPGFSGAPVWDVLLGGIVGIVTTADAARRTARMIPLAHIQAFCPVTVVRRQKTAVPQIANLERPRPTRLLLDWFCPGIHTFLCRVNILQSSPNWRPIQNYLSTKRAELSHEIAKKTYIPLIARDLDVNDSEPKFARDGAFLTPIQQLIKEILGESRGGGAANAQIEVMSRKSKTVRNIVQRLTLAKQPIVLLGDPGTGKSLTLLQTAYELTRKQCRRQYPTVCLLIPLGGFCVPDPVDQESIKQFIAGEVDEEIQPFLEQLDQQGRLVILFDGMDEMSRDRYNAHTRALSIFADSRPYGSRILFSCRITDFSPELRHDRLVLLPFRHPQVLAYLCRQKQLFPLEIDGESYTPRSLAERLKRGDLPLQPNNPFVLWLLCIFLQEKKSWPKSRVELLDAYSRYAYRSKMSEGNPGFTIPEDVIDAAFLVWAKLAFEITCRNRGQAISLVEAEQLLGVESLSFLQDGKRCGLLQESIGLDESLIRFQHQRFQEFFAAYHLCQQAAREEAMPPAPQSGVARGEVVWDAQQWLDKLDAPRWQETLFNLVMLGGGHNALAALRDAMEQATESHMELLEQTEENDNDQDQLENRIYDEEYVLADRIELASRILSRRGSGTTEAQELIAPFEKGLYHLAESGNPISQVKMLRASQQLDSIDTFRVVRGALESEVGWVRNQAHIIAASGTQYHAASDALREDVLFSFASGRFTERVTDYLKIGFGSKQYGLVGVAFLGLALIAVHVLTLIGLLYGASSWVASGAAEYSQQEFDEASYRKAVYWRKAYTDKQIEQFRKNDEKTKTACGVFSDVLNHRYFLVTSIIILTIASVLVFKDDAAQYEVWIAIVGYGIIFVAAIACSFWSAGGGLAFAVLVFGGMATVGIVAPIASVFLLLTRAIFVTVFAVLAYPWAKSLKYIGTMWNTMWEEAEYTDLFGLLAMPLTMALVGAVYFGIWVAASWVFEKLDFWVKAIGQSSWLPSFFPPLVNGALAIIFLTTIAIIVFGGVALLLTSKRQKNEEFKEYFGAFIEAFKELIAACLGFGLAATLPVFAIWGVIVVGQLVSEFVATFVEWLAEYVGTFASYIFLAVLVAIAVIAIGFVFWRLAQILWQIAMNLRIKTQRGEIRIQPDLWLNELKRADASRQAIMLSMASPARMGLDTDEFVDFFRQARKHVRQDPALSVYCRKLDEYLAIAKQNRVG